MSFILWAGVWALMLAAVRLVSGSWRQRVLVKLVLSPGVILLTICRLASCQLTRTRYLLTPLWQPGALLTPKAPQLGARLALALIPFATVALALIGLESWLLSTGVTETTLPVLEPDLRRVPLLLASLFQLSASAFTRALTLEYWNGATLLFFYLAFAIVIYGAPTRTEWLSLIKTLAASALIVATFGQLGIGAKWWSTAWFIDLFYSAAALQSMAAVLATTLFALCALSVLHLLSALAAIIRPRGARQNK